MVAQVLPREIKLNGSNFEALSAIQGIKTRRSGHKKIKSVGYKTENIQLQAVVDKIVYS
jgi:hypothetical protein